MPSGAVLQLSVVAVAMTSADDGRSRVPRRRERLNIIIIICICIQSTNRGAVTILITRESPRRLLLAPVPRGGRRGRRRFVFTFSTLWPTVQSHCCCRYALSSVVDLCFARCPLLLFLLTSSARCFDRKKPVRSRFTGITAVVFLECLDV